MTVASPPWAIQAASHPATAVRQSNQGSFGSPFGAFAGGIQPTTGGGGHGVVGATDYAVAQNGTPNMSVNVSGGLCAIRGTESQHQGVYGPCYNDATVNLAIAAADPTNARKDLVVAKIRDAQYSGASNDFSLAVVTGTPAGSPVDPSVPANALVLARVNVAAAAASIVNANITDLRIRAYAAGGIGTGAAALVKSSPDQGDVRYVTNAALPSGSVGPQVTIRPDCPGLYVYDQRWDPPWNLPWGIMAYAQLTSNQTGITTLADITSLSAAFTAVANRVVRTTLVLPVVSISAQGTLVASVTDAANAQKTQANALLAATFVTPLYAAVIETTSAGTFTRKGRISANAGTGSITGGATIVNYILIEDIGPQGSPA